MSLRYHVKNCLVAAAFLFLYVKCVLGWKLVFVRANLFVFLLIRFSEVSKIFEVCVKSGEQRLYCAGAVGLGFEPLGFTPRAFSFALDFFDVFLSSSGAQRGTSSHEVI